MRDEERTGLRGPYRSPSNRPNHRSAATPNRRNPNRRPTAVACAAADQQLRLNLALLAVAAAVALLIAWWGGGLLVLRPPAADSSAL